MSQMSQHDPDHRGGAPESPNEVADHEAAETEVPDEAADDVAERPGTSSADHDHADELADEWGRESFPGSDPPAHY